MRRVNLTDPPFIYDANDPEGLPAARLPGAPAIATGAAGPAGSAP